MARTVRQGMDDDNALTKSAQGSPFMQGTLKTFEAAGVERFGDPGPLGRALGLEPLFPSSDVGEGNTPKPPPAPGRRGSAEVREAGRRRRRQQQKQAQRSGRQSTIVTGPQGTEADQSENTRRPTLVGS